MNLHEHQAKALFAEHGLPVPQGHAAETPEEAVAAARKLGGGRWAVKVQAHAGGRGKAGGVAVVDGLPKVRAFAKRWLGKKLVTAQTGSIGRPVSCIYVESCTEFTRELYLSAVVDRNLRRIVFMASSEGGVEIEKVAAQTPDKIFQAIIDPFVGAQPHQGRSLAFQLSLNNAQVKQFTALFLGLYRMFVALDCSLLEINPLVVTKDGDILCLDAKVNIDGNALHRQPALAKLRDPTQEDAREIEASEFGLNYIALDGDIGCMVNGAGLAMGTMDLVKLYGGSPANFLDVGGSADREAVSEAFKIILSDANVRAVLINIFGGIVSCAVIAEGIIGAVKEVGVRVPVVVRFEGNNAEAGSAILEQSSLNIIAAESLEDAAKKSVAAAGRVP